ncbi:hypothetical protein HELRODRAFT_180205 [Helobdella robusta]|uniref:Uncharacterized protein n=1 Tax=Helobdella robusta TaxID=6412 RepID=T1FFK4_HELRO|nr:hypothetical protein HELRODRAFT_180205 [Helobdella robusta]ESN94045.1 hypothetical protein HELRODRAFT_180205 [Helobdella robusta]
MTKAGPLSQRLWLSSGNKTVSNTQVQQRLPVTNMTLKQPLTTFQQQQPQLQQLQQPPSSLTTTTIIPAITSASAIYTMRSGNLVDFNNLQQQQQQQQQQISLSIGIQPIIKSPPNIIYQPQRTFLQQMQQPHQLPLQQPQQQQQANKTMLSPTIPINLSTSVVMTSSSSGNKGFQ